MSAPGEKAPRGATRAEEDVVPAGRIFVIGLVAVVIFIAASVTAAAVLSWKRQELWPEGPPPAPAQAGQHEVGMVEQVQFENQTQVEDLNRSARERLGTYGWVDRSRKLIHMPIGKAMELVTQGVKP